MAYAASIPKLMLPCSWSETCPSIHVTEKDGSKAQAQGLERGETTKREGAWY